jgi:hypothetical protein
MEQILSLITFFGGFLFIYFGIYIANSIEAKENKTTAIILTGFTVLGAFSFLIGMIGLLIFWYFNY